MGAIKERPPPDQGDGLQKIVDYPDDNHQVSPKEETVKRNPTFCCYECGSPFLPTRSDGRFCSNACRQRAYRRRRDGDTIHNGLRASEARNVCKAVVGNGRYLKAISWHEAQSAAIGGHKLGLVLHSLALLTEAGHIGPHEHEHLAEIADDISRGVEPSLRLRSTLNELACRARDLRWRYVT
jgi:hypothetical protein